MTNPKLTPEKLAELRRLASVWESEKPRLDTPIDYRDELLLRASLPALIEAAEERDRLRTKYTLLGGLADEAISNAKAAEQLLTNLERRIREFAADAKADADEEISVDHRALCKSIGLNLEKRFPDILGEEGDGDA